MKAVLGAMNLLNSVDYVLTECEANWIRQNQPEIWEKTHKFLFLSGYLTYKLVGEFVDSVGNMVGFVPFDYKRQTWAGKSDMKWKMCPMDPAILNSLVKPGEVLGFITKKAATETGLPVGLPLFAAAADKACEVLGSDAFRRRLRASAMAPRQRLKQPTRNTSRSCRSFRRIQAPCPGRITPR